MPHFALCRCWPRFSLHLGGLICCIDSSAFPKNRQPVPGIIAGSCINLVHQLRSLRLSSDVYVEFELESLPRNAPTSRSRGWLAWSWSDGQLMQRFALLPAAIACP